MFRRTFLECSMNVKVPTGKYDSPIFHNLQTAVCFGVYNELMRMINGLAIYAKRNWKNSYELTVI